MIAKENSIFCHKMAVSKKETTSGIELKLPWWYNPPVSTCLPDTLLSVYCTMVTSPVSEPYLVPTPTPFPPHPTTRSSHASLLLPGAAEVVGGARPWTSGDRLVLSMAIRPPLRGNLPHPPNCMPLNHGSVGTTTTTTAAAHLSRHQTRRYWSHGPSSIATTKI